jgi:acyl-CoA synthetase (AMP-forming)/AMP-acid ligase II
VATALNQDRPAVHRAATRLAGFTDIAQCIAATAARRGAHIAVDDGARALDYAEFDRRAWAAAAMLRTLGLGAGDRVAVLAENRIEYLELALAAARTGSILAALNWRFSAPEIAHCAGLTQPAVVFVSRRFLPLLREAGIAEVRVILLEDEYDALLAPELAAGPARTACALDPEDGCIILYTSGTTGMSKAALISHRAEVSRLALGRIDSMLAPGDNFVAWAPLFHMVALEHALHVLALGGTVHVVDGADIDRIVDLALGVPQWWLVLLPGMIDRVVETMASRGKPPARLKIVGALADLVSADLVAATSRLFKAPYWNTFGSTETGMLPFAGTRFAPGERPATLAKAVNSHHLFKLVDDADREVARGQPGEVAVRGPTVFSGYWNAEATNAHEFRGGWFHMGDVFVEREDGRYDYVDRAKYLIKTGAENVYPAEIERALMADPRVVEAVVVRRPDARWGEVPVAFVCCHAPPPTVEELFAVCRASLARYKQPKEIRFVAAPADFPRSISGKVQRQELEKLLR